MKAMILAAGLGTRLRPLTDHRPKALVEINGCTLLEITLSRLRSFGVHEVIVNVHHFADMMVDYLKANHDFGMRIEVSREESLLDTGGALKKAAPFFFEDSKSSASRSGHPFIVHNVDVLSAIDLARMMQFHVDNQALATLAVQERKTSRYLLFDNLFDNHLQLCGRRSGNDPPENDPPEMIRVCGQAEALAFSGIHVISPRLLTMMSEDGAFSIISTYMRLAAQGEKILAFRADEYYWRDLGRLENIAQAAEDLKHKVIAQ
jgi:NDP-sugar pyrophosphorylase family protein